MKYIVLRKKFGQNMFREFPIIFPDALIHSDVADAIRSMTDMKFAVAVSAGSIASMGIDAEATGKSETLNLSSRPQDTVLIRMMDYQHGVID